MAAPDQTHQCRVFHACPNGIADAQRTIIQSVGDCLFTRVQPFGRGFPQRDGETPAIFGQDLAEAVQLQSLMAETLSPGPLDILVNNTGICDLLREKRPSGRTSTPAEIARTVHWLCEPAAHNLTATAIPIDGGWTAQ